MLNEVKLDPVSTGVPHPAPDSSPILSELSATLDQFAVIRHPLFKGLAAKLPLVIILLLLADKLIGQCAFACDLFRMTWSVTIVLELLVVNALFDELPEAFRTLWNRNVIRLPGDSNLTGTAFRDYLVAFQEALNSRWAWVAGLVFAYGGFIFTYPMRYWFTYGHPLYSQLSDWIFFYIGTGAILEVLAGALLGLLAWRFVIVGIFVTRLGERFTLKLQPSHPDRSGGLAPLGNLCWLNALLILVPALVLSSWIFGATLPGMEVYTVWVSLFKQWLVVLPVAAAFLFFRPLYEIHQQMVHQRRAIQSDLDDLSRKMDELATRLRTESESLAPEEITKILGTLKAMMQVYDESSHIPTWPFDTSLALKFAAAEMVPLLSLIGVGTPLVNLIKAIIPFFAPPS